MADSAKPHEGPISNGADTGNSTSSSGSRIVTTVSDSAGSAYAYAQRSLDRVVAPSSRQKAYDDASAYASTRPILFSFVVAQLLFLLLPIVIFSVFVLSVTGFALGLALAGATLFVLFWIGVALAFLVPVLLVASFLAVLSWAWVVGGFLASRWLYARIPTGSRGVEGYNGAVVKNEKEI